LGGAARASHAAWAGGRTGAVWCGRRLATGGAKAGGDEVDGGVGREDDCAAGVEAGEVSFLPEWERDAAREVETGAFDIDSSRMGVQRRLQRSVLAVRGT
jgi:hypothetical protein